MKVPKARKLPSGMYRVQVMINGERISITDESAKVAEAKAAALKAQLMEASKSPRSMTVGEAINRYIESKDAVLSPSTIRGYISMRESVIAPIQHLQLESLTQEQIQRYINKLAKEYSPKYVSNVHGLLSAVIGAYRPDMALKTTLPQKEKKEIQIPTIEEIQTLATAARATKFELPFYLAVWMGLRTSEIRGLTWDCIKGESLHVKQARVKGVGKEYSKLTKTYSGDRKIRIPPYINELLTAQPKTSEFVVPCGRNYLYKHLVLLCDRCGLPHYRFHDLRHVQASVMLALGVPDKYAMERMGHASTNMLKNVYQHTMRSKSDEVANAVDDFFEKNLHTNLHTDGETA